MLRYLPVLLAPGMLCAAGASSFAQSANTIIDRHIRACGGSRALSQIHSNMLQGDLVRPADGKTGLYTVIVKQPNLFFSETSLGEERTSEGFNGKSAWRRDSSGIVTTLNGEEAAILESIAIAKNSSLLKYNSKDRHRLKVTGRELLEGRPAYRLEFTTQEGARRTTFFDPQNYLVVKDRIEIGRASIETSYREYQNVEGIMEPSRIELKRGQEVFLVSNIHVRHNAEVENVAFDFPAPSAASLPDITGLLTEIQRNQKTVEDVLENYTYTKIEEETDVDDQFRVKGKHEREYEVFYVGGSEIQRLVSKDGAGLSSADQQKEDEKTKKLVAQRERAAKVRTGKSSENHNNEDELHISTFLRACKFTHARREWLRGQEVIVFDVEPNPTYHPQNLDERLAQELEGVMWVDENARQVVRLEAHLANSAKIAGGLLGTINRGSAAIFEQTLVNNEVWLPSYVEIHLSGRYLLFKTYRENTVIRYHDYKKFRVETVEKPQPPKPEK